MFSQQKFTLSFYIYPIYFLCRLWKIAAHRDHSVRHLYVRPSVRPSGSHTFLVFTHSYVSQATHAFLGMLPLFLNKEQQISRGDAFKNIERVFTIEQNYPNQYFSILNLSNLAFLASLEQNKWKNMLLLCVFLNIFYSKLQNFNLTAKQYEYWQVQKLYAA